MPKFNVGDKVVGNRYANVYALTTEGWVGTVVGVSASWKYITVQDDDEGGQFDVDAYCFDLYECASVDESDSARIDEFFSEFQ